MTDEWILAACAGLDQFNFGSVNVTGKTGRNSGIEEESDDPFLATQGDLEFDDVVEDMNLEGEVVPPGHGPLEDDPPDKTETGEEP